MKTVKFLRKFFAGFGFLVLFLVADLFAVRDFTQRTQFNVAGDATVIGNTVLCKLSDGACVEPTGTNSNADTDLQKAPQSYSTLDMPANSTVEYARLYWQGRITGDSWSNTERNSAKAIQFRKVGAASYNSLTADVFDEETTASSGSIQVYSASKDVTSIVKAGGAGRYEVNPAAFETTVGDVADGLGAYGAWTLVVVYSTAGATQIRNITVFDGYKKVMSGNNVEFSVSGFLTPSGGDVKAEVYVFAGEGDKYLSKNGDVVKLKGMTYSTGYTTLGTFDSRISTSGTRSPSLINNNGIDIHKYNVGETSGAFNKIQNNETGAGFQFTSDQDTYFPSLLVFATDIYSPSITISKIPSTGSGGDLQPGDQIDYTATFTNVGQEAASEMVLFDDFSANLQKKQDGNDTNPAVYLTDVMDRNATKIKQSIRLSDQNSLTTWNCPTGLSGLSGCNGGYDANCSVDFNASLGATTGATKVWCALPTVAVGKTYTMKFSINLSTAPDTKDQNIKVSNQMFASYKNALIGGSPIVTGSNLADAGNYTGESFAKVDAAETSIAGNPPPQASRKIYTKIVGLPTTLNVAHFDSTLTNIVPYTQGLVGWRLIPAGNCPSGDGSITAWQDVNLSTGATQISFTPSQANQALKIQFAPKNNGYPSAKRTCSSDTFAIRPNNFSVSMVGGGSPNMLKAGETYNFAIAAKDISNATVTTYNQTNANVNIGTAKKYAPDGTESLSMSGATSNMSGNNYTFTNGITGNMSFAFSDVGKIKIDINDTNWAATDAADGTSVDVRTITGEGNFTFIPFQFAISNVTLRGADGGSNGSFVYLSNDLNMSARVDTTITAQNKQGATTQNFSSASWENNISITPSARYTAPNGTIIDGVENSYSANKFGFTNGVANVVFNDANSSKVVRFNFPRDSNVTVRNPFSFTNANGDLNITVASKYSDAGFADVTIENNATNKDANITSLNFSYARAHAPRQRATTAAHTVNIFYETYCFGTDATGVTCNKALLPNGANSRHTDDVRWYQNTNHSAQRDGNVTAAARSGGGIVTAGAITNGANNATTTALTYDGTKGYPYKTTMEMTTLSDWLVYHPTSATILTNPFQIEYDRNNTNWSGAAAAGQKTKEVGGAKTNRRKMW